MKAYNGSCRNLFRGDTALILVPPDCLLGSVNPLDLSSLTVLIHNSLLCRMSLYIFDVILLWSFCFGRLLGLGLYTEDFYRVLNVCRFDCTFVAWSEKNWPVNRLSTTVCPQSLCSRTFWWRFLCF